MGKYGFSTILNYKSYRLAVMQNYIFFWEMYNYCATPYRNRL
jgi:hypothetical protein